jgi:hypothetical protein
MAGGEDRGVRDEEERTGKAVCVQDNEVERDAAERKWKEEKGANISNSMERRRCGKHQNENK